MKRGLMILSSKIIIVLLLFGLTIVSAQEIPSPGTITFKVSKACNLDNPILTEKDLFDTQTKRAEQQCEPIAEVEISIYDRNNIFLESGKTNEDGIVSFNTANYAAITDYYKSYPKKMIDPPEIFVRYKKEGYYTDTTPEAHFINDPSRDTSLLIDKRLIKYTEEGSGMLKIELQNAKTKSPLEIEYEKNIPEGLTGITVKLFNSNMDSVGTRYLYGKENSEATFKDLPVGEYYVSVGVKYYETARVYRVVDTSKEFKSIPYKEGFIYSIPIKKDSAMQTIIYMEKNENIFNLFISFLRRIFYNR